MTVYARKTHSTRVVPILPRLAMLLREAYERREDGCDAVLTLSECNLHRTILEALEAAGVPRWDDLLQTLRRSCETDLVNAGVAAHAAAAFLGHSPQVSQRHYLQIPDRLLDEVAGLVPSSALHQALQHRAELPGNGAHGARRASKRPLAGAA